MTRRADPHQIHDVVRAALRPPTNVVRLVPEPRAIRGDTGFTGVLRTFDHGQARGLILGLIRASTRALEGTLRRRHAWTFRF